MNRPQERPADSAGVISDQLAAQQRTRLKAIRRVSKLRQKASAEIERLILFLDACDPYVTTELEEACEGEGEACEDEAADVENHGEPSLGFLERHPNGYVSADYGGTQVTGMLCAGAGDDREQECEDEGADVENVGEPSLGSLDDIVDQSRWCCSDLSDLEEQCEDEGIA